MNSSFVICSFLYRYLYRYYKKSQDFYVKPLQHENNFVNLQTIRDEKMINAKY